MVDFWVAVVITFSITLVTILADWIAGRIIIYTRTISILRRIIFSGVSNEDAREQSRQELERLRASRALSLTWGTELGTVAISLDFTALGIWIYQPKLFPFFSKFNVTNVERDIQIWLIVLLIHIILFVLSLIFKHHFNESVGLTSPEELQDFLRSGWMSRNGWLLASNSVGFITLLTAILVFTNSM